MRKNYEHNLNKLQESAIEMGQQVTQALKDSLRAIIDKNEDLAQDVIVGDKYINSKENAIETQALSLLLRESPVASDFRFVTATLKLINDLERIGDQAADISYLNLKLIKKNISIQQDVNLVQEMAEKVIKMLELAVESYENSDLDLVKKIIEMEAKTDELFEGVKSQVVKDVKEDKFSTKSSLDIFMIAKYLERIGDHCENIAERVHYSVTGENIVK